MIGTGDASRPPRGVSAAAKAPETWPAERSTGCDGTGGVKPASCVTRTRPLSDAAPEIENGVSVMSPRPASSVPVGDWVKAPAMSRSQP